MSATLPTITIIVAVYNGAEKLQRCIDSVFEQTYPNKQLIVIDGCSTDGSAEIIEANRDRLHYSVSEPDHGIYDAWNKGIKQATGDWICFLGADDYLWKSNVLECLAPHLLDAYPKFRVVYGNASMVTESGRIIRSVGRPWPIAKLEFGDHLSVPHPGLMHHQSLFSEFGGFDHTFKLAGDYDLLLNELKDADALFVPDVTTVGIQHGGCSNSPSAMPRYLEENRRIYVKHHLPHPNWVSSSSTFRNMLIASILSRFLTDNTIRKLSDFARRLRGKPEIWNDQ